MMSKAASIGGLFRDVNFRSVTLHPEPIPVHCQFVEPLGRREHTGGPGGKYKTQTSGREIWLIVQCSSRNKPWCWQLAQMARYFFDFRSTGSSSIDEEGEELTDMGAAHSVAVAALSEAMRDIVLEGGSDQRFAVEVRDDIGPVLRVSVVLESQLFRKQ